MWLALVLAAQAQETPPIDAQLFHPSIGGHRMVWADEVGTRAPAPFHAALLGHYVKDPLVYTTPDGTEVGLVTDVLQLDTMFALHAGRFGLGVDLPVYLLARGEGTEESALGDVAIEGKFRFLDREHAPFGLGIGARVWFPTATTTLALGTEEPEYELQLNAEQAFGPLLLVGNVGTASGPEVALERVTIADFLVARLAGSWAFGPETGVSLETGTRFSYTAPIASSATTAQWLASVYAGIGDGMMLRAGGGTGIGDGLGSPDFRVLLGLGWAPEPEDVEVPEPVVAERETDCPAEGAPPGVDITLRVVDAAHAPIATATSRFEGMADPCGHGASADHEVVLEDSARSGPVAFRQDLTLDGHVVSIDLVLAPPPAPTAVLEGDRITLSESVKFATESAAILPGSTGLLDEVAALLRDNPAVERVRIEGHTDTRGSDGYNLELSLARAASVRTYLVSHGIPPERLRSEGFGERVPLDPREAPDAWAVNRRVDLFVESATE